MKLKRTTLAPVLVAAVTLVSGGWLLGQGKGSGTRAAAASDRLLREVLQRVSADYVEPQPADSLYRKAAEGLLKELGDPHTVLMTPEQYENLHVATSGEYGGLGIRIDERDGWVTVVSTLPGTPAERAGVLAGDRIVQVDGKSAQKWTSDEAVKHLRGPKGSSVNVRIARVGVDQPIEYRMAREEIHVNSVTAAFNLEGEVAYVPLSVFAQTSTEEIRAALDRLRSQGAKKVVLDLRENPGGLLEQGVLVSNLFLDRGEAVVETRARDSQENQTYRAEGSDRYDGMPMVVLVDEYSASASEIVAGALQDHDRALVLGQTSYGKGSVQSVFPLSGGYYLKMTTGKWYTPSGRSIQKEHKPGADRSDPEAAAVDSAVGDTAKRKPYRTDAGRTVLGGGGIVPDLIVPDTTTLAEREFLKAAYGKGRTFDNVVNAYAVEFGRRNPSLPRNFQVTPEIRSELLRRLQAAGVPVTPTQFAAAQRWVDRSLGSRIALVNFGEAGQLQRSVAQDPQVAAALRLLRASPDQASLFRAARAFQTAQGTAANATR